MCDGIPGDDFTNYGGSAADPIDKIKTDDSPLIKCIERLTFADPIAQSLKGFLIIENQRSKSLKKLVDSQRKSIDQLNGLMKLQSKLQGPPKKGPYWEVRNERLRQDKKWGGPEQDDAHTTAEFVQLIQDYAGWARTMAGMDSNEKCRRRLIQVAALAISAIESIDRKQVGSNE